VITTGIDVDVTRDQWLAFEDAARERGYLTMISFNPNDPAIEDKLLLTMRDRCADGVLLFPSEIGDHKELQSMVRRGEPVVTIDGQGRVPFLVDDVTVDHYIGGRMQGQHLLDIGRRRVCLANSAHTCYVVDQRIRGVVDVLTEAGCPPVKMDLPFEAWPIGKGNEVAYMREYLRTNRTRFDAIAAVGDSLGLWVMGIAMSLGIRVPEELAFVGYDGVSYSANTLMPMTTIANPTREVGVAAFDFMMRRMQYPTDPPRQTLIPPRLVIRESTLPGSTSPETSMGVA
jgi:LacI family transcriptional regulator